MRRIFGLAILLCVAAGRGSCGGSGGGGSPGGAPGSAVHPGTPLDIPFGTYQIVANRANRFFASLEPEHVVYADELQASLDAGEPVFVADVRDDATYGIGHIPTAVNLPLDALFTAASLSQLPVDGTTIVVVSKDGHAAALAAGALGTLGYNVYPLNFGMVGWSASTSVAVASSNGLFQRISGLDGPIVQ